MKLFTDPVTAPIPDTGIRISDEFSSHPTSGIGHPASDSAPLAVRIDRSNPNHHLWLNNGTWYIHYTVCPTPATAERVRRSLRTKDLNEARKLRDQVLETHVLRQKEARPE